MSKLDAALVQRNKQAIEAASPLFDELNKSWDQIEKFLRKQGILHEVEHQIGTLDDLQYGAYASRLIGIQKRKGEWRVCYGVVHFQDPDEDAGWIPVTECTTDLRIELLEHVAGLFEELVKSNEKFVPEMEKAVAKSHSVLADLGIAKKK